MCLSALSDLNGRMPTNPACFFLFWFSLYDIFWGPEVDDELKALEEARPDVKIIS